MDINLFDQPNKQFEQLLTKTVKIVSQLYSNIDDKKVFHGKDWNQIKALFNGSFPTRGLPINEVIEKIEKDVLPNVATHYSPHFYAWITSSPTQASILAEILSTALNVNATTWMNAASASEIEQQVIKWIVQFIKYAPDANGVLLSGGSMANLTALKVCLKQKANYDIDHEGISAKSNFTFYVSDQGHFSIEKAIKTLGVGVNYLRRIKTNSDLTMNIKSLEQHIKLDIENGLTAVCVIANMGTVNTGSVDDILGIHAIAKKYNLWLHLDAAYGGLAAGTSLRDSIFRGLELADSITLDAHKWLFVPFECSCLLMKDPRHLTSTFSHIPEYQRFEPDENKVDYSEYSLQQSRNFKALKVWMNFKVYGSEAIGDAIQKSILQIKRLAKEIENDHEFELINAPVLSIICFRYNQKGHSLTPNQVNQANSKIVDLVIKEGKIFIKETVIDGQIVLRACCTNFRREYRHLEFMLKSIRDVGRKVFLEYGI